MAKNEDELLLGTQVLTSKESRDSDGDGVSDVQESLDGTNPDDASDHREADPILNPLESGDPRYDLERGTLEPETVLDPTANMPAGQSIPSGLGSLTNLDGTAFTTTVDHDGVALPGGHATGTNPRDLLGTSEGSSGSGPGGEFDGGLSNMDLVSSKAGGSNRNTIFHLGVDEMQASDDAMDAARAADTAAKAADDAARAARLAKDEGTPSAARAAQDEADAAQARADQAAADAAAAQAKADAAAKALAEAKDDSNTDPDAEEYVPTQEEIDLAIVRQGGDTKPVEGGAPQIDVTAPPPDKSDLIINRGEGGDIVEVTPLKGALDAPVVNQINPDSGFGPQDHEGTGTPPSEGGGDTGQPSFTSDAMTASDAIGGPEMSVAGSGGGGIQSVAPSAPDGAGAADGTIAPSHDAGARAVDSFAADYLGDAAAADVGIIIPDVDRPVQQAGIIIPETDRPAAPALEADLVTSGLAADLGGDLAPADDDFSAVREDFRAEPLEELAPLDDRDETFDDA